MTYIRWPRKAVLWATCTLLAVLALPFTASAQYDPAKPIPISELSDKTVASVINSEGRPTGIYNEGAPELPSGISISTLSNYAQLLQLMHREKLLYVPQPVYHTGKPYPGEYFDGEVITDVDYAPDHSTTNVRTPGVDEPDIIKTDGKYIYYLDKYEGVTIVKAQGSKMSVVSTIKHADAMYYCGMLLDGDWLVVFADEDTENGSFTACYVYDIANRAWPVLRRTVRIEGSWKDARLLNHVVYFSAFQYRSAYTHSAKLRDVLPTYYDSAAEGEFAVAPGNIHYWGTTRYCTSIAAFRIDSDAPANVQAEYSGNEYMYMSSNAIYIFDSWKHNDKGVYTQLSRYTLDGDAVRFNGSAEVDGEVIGHYAIDEYKGQVRIATTTRRGNDVYILNPSLHIVGSLQNLAQGEHIEAARFMGDTAYLVTYQQVDPLFVLDLSVPAQPRVSGYLKIPGFSVYLHPFGTKYLVGLGYATEEVFDTNEAGEDVPTGNVRQTGMKASLFDISDPARPREVSALPIGVDGTDSSAVYYPETMMIDAGKGVIAFPIYYVEDDNYTGNGDEWSGGLVLSVKPDKIRIKGKIKSGNNNYYYYYYYDNAARFCRIGNTLYFATANDLRAYNYSTLRLLAKLKMPKRSE